MVHSGGRQGEKKSSRPGSKNELSIRLKTIKRGEKKGGRVAKRNQKKKKRGGEGEMEQKSN